MKNYPPGKVLKNIEHIYKADLQIKGVERPGISDGQVLRDMVYNIMH